MNEENINPTPTEAVPINNVNIDKPKKGKKIGLIVALCILATLLIGGGTFAAVFLSWRQSDSTVVLDAITGAIKQNNIGVQGAIDVEFGESSQAKSGLKSIRALVDTRKKGPDSTGIGTIIIKTTTDQETSIGLSGAYVSDGTLYFRIKGLKPALNQLDLSTEVSTAIGYLDSVLEEIDDQWYKITAADISTFGTEASDTYSCFVDAINASASQTSANQLADLYAKYPFILPTRQDARNSDGSVVYNVKWDTTDLSTFLNNMKDLDTYSSLLSCPSLETESTTVTPEDVTIPADLPTLSLHIDEWTHELRGFTTHYEEDGNSLNVDLGFFYGDKVVVEIPTEAKSITDLTSSIESAIKSVVTGIAQDQVNTFCATYAGTPYYAQCTASFDDYLQSYLDTIDLSDIFSITEGSQV